MIIDADNIPRYTYEEYKLWQEDWELIEGYPYWLKPSGLMHSIVKGNALVQTMVCLKNNCRQSDCMAVMSTDWIINDDTVVRPDILVVNKKVETDYLQFSPVLIIEIVTPYSHVTDTQVKFEIYRQQGVKYYLIVDYEKLIVQVFELIDNVYQIGEKNLFKVNDDCEINFDFNQFWKNIDIKIRLN